MDLNPADPNDLAQRLDRKATIEAVLGLIEKNKAVVKQGHASGVPLDQQDAARLRVEIADALKLISDLRDIRLSEALNSAAVPVRQDTPSSWEEWMGTLESLQRLLETRLAMLPSSSLGRLVPTQTTAPEGSRPTHATSPSPDEEALIGRVNERLFASWGPRLMFACFTAALALAIGGPLVIGGTTVNIRQSLLEAAKAAKEDIAGIAKMAQSTADAQVTLVERTSKTAQTIITDEQKRVTAELGGLKDKAVGEVIEKLDLRHEIEPLRQRIENTAKGFDGEIEALRKQQLTVLSTRIDALLGKLSADEQKEREFTPQLSSLEALSHKINQIETNVATSEGYATAVGAAAKAAVNAQSDAQSARESRDATFATLKELNRDIGTQLAIFGESRGKINQLTQSIALLRVSVCDEPDLGAGPWVAQAQLNCLKQRIAAIETHIKMIQVTAAPPQGAESEPPLSKTEWRSIQRALANQGFYKGAIDGNPGRNPERSQTRRAVKNWQGSNGEQRRDGQLSKEQVRTLIGT